MLKRIREALGGKKAKANANARRKRTARALSEHLMRRLPAKAYVGAMGGVYPL